ncbi:EutN/CcmL family microcompartment protein [Carboxydothermus ferrireducens]|uniref:Ethanolamine utilization protein EutN n=1 Tax=Carboxydothermus ferrireducens DSM 11255 TaxID=1119529 RepID=A0ABX2REM7_9THEO|nr:EutN/CcmL family microcompartment protein [Carboxydothermus ferrireducens]NYE58483.1 ethanolamine utilization protein EutN [Carboxydothermus ferrireducens DSM 11255]
MILGKVIDNVWSTKKDESLTGIKLMVVKALDEAEGRIIVAADLIGAGIGETVIISMGGSAARKFAGLENTPVDAVIVGIVDERMEES